jgi:hypothetical protein
VNLPRIARVLNQPQAALVRGAKPGRFRNRFVIGSASHVERAVFFGVTRQHD